MLLPHTLKLLLTQALDIQLYLHKVFPFFFTGKLLLFFDDTA